MTINGLSTSRWGKMSRLVSRPCENVTIPVRVQDLIEPLVDLFVKLCFIRASGRITLESLESIVQLFFVALLQDISIRVEPRRPCRESCSTPLLGKSI